MVVFTGDTGPSDPVMPSTTASIPKLTESSFWCHCIVVLFYGFVLNYILPSHWNPPHTRFQWLGSSAGASHPVGGPLCDTPTELHNHLQRRQINSPGNRRNNYCCIYCAKSATRKRLFSVSDQSFRIDWNPTFK